MASIPTYCCRTDSFKYSFSPNSICEWNKLNINTHSAKSLIHFTNSLLKIGKPSAKSIFNFQTAVVLKFLTSLRLAPSYLNSYIFDHNFSNSINRLCACSFKIESLSYFFLCFYYFTNILSTLLDEITKIDSNLLSLPKMKFWKYFFAVIRNMI